MDSTEPAPVADTTTARSIGRFVVDECLGRGAMGTVYRAQDPLIERTVAVKVLSVDLAPTEHAQFRERFFREAKAAGRLNHSNIVTIYDIGESDGTPYIAMEYLPGLTLRETLDSGAVLPVRRVVEIAMLVARGLDYAHQNGVIHRDVKPANIMLARSGQVKIMDFGIAVASDTGRTQTGALLGSPRYMAPEQIANGAVDARTDIFSLGVTLYEMLTGKDPFEGQTIPEVMHKILLADPVPPSALNPDIPERLEQIVMRALAKNPADRFGSARDLGLELGSLRRELKHSNALAAAPQDTAAALGMAATQVVDRGAIHKAVVDRTVPPPRSSGKSGDRLAMVLAAVVGLVVVLVVMLVPDSRGPALVDLERPRTDAEVVAPLAQLDPAPDESPDGAVTPDADTDDAVASQPAIDPDAPDSAPVEPVARRSAQAPTSRTATAAGVAARAAANPAKVAFSVLPWGEVLIGGTVRGVTPPLREIEVPPGRHRIEIRNADFAPYVEWVTLKSGTTHHINHRFR